MREKVSGIVSGLLFAAFIALLVLLLQETKMITPASAVGYWIG